MGSTDKIITVNVFNTEVGKLGYDIDTRKTYFQYNPDYLNSGKYDRLFPFIFKKNNLVQIFDQYEGNTFKGLPPMISDSLPDMFGNTLFQQWLKTNNKDKISPLEQLTYVSNRGMGALEYHPTQDIPRTSEIDINEMIDVLNKVLNLKSNTTAQGISEMSLLNIFKIGTSAGGARAKILVSEHKSSGLIKPGDIEYSNDYNHYLVKLCMDLDAGYNKEVVEYAYHTLAIKAGIKMMPSKLIDNKHFATLRYDRKDGKKSHTLTASGLTGWDFMKPDDSSYENLFDLAIALKVPHKDLQELYRRMVFNLTFANIDDHLKNHSFIYDENNNTWGIAPMYDVTYPLNALNNYMRVSRALSVNNKREDIELSDLLIIADQYSIKNPKGIIEEVSDVIPNWRTTGLEIQAEVIEAIENDFKTFL